MRSCPQPESMMRSRKSSASDGLSVQPSGPTSFFLTRDPDEMPSRDHADTRPDNDASPVRSLKDVLEAASQQSRHTPIRHQQRSSHSESRRRSTIRPLHVEEKKAVQYSPSSQTPSDTIPPSFLSFPDISGPSSPKSLSSRSLQKSDNESIGDGGGSQAVASSSDEDDEEEGAASMTRRSEIDSSIQDSEPQLIMPSIKMPSRRPFTSRGKQIGRFKILVAGAKSSGRTSLIKSIVQLCEDIVHVDPMVNRSVPSSKSSPVGFSVNEIYASTKAYPSWWSDIDESRILKRRRSMGDVVLERNICFVDTTDAGKAENACGYIEQQFLKTINSIHQPDGELAALMSGRGGSHVDLVLYLVNQDTLINDIERIKRLSRLSNVLPLIAKADLLNDEQIRSLKTTPELSMLTMPRISSTTANEPDVQVLPPFCVSSANGPDFDNMDASLLMSPEYVQPLMPSELAVLIRQALDPEMIAYFRHVTAKKLIAWYSSEPRLTSPPSPSLRSAHPSTLHSPIHSSLSQSGQLIPVTSHFSLNTSNSFALAKVVDHTLREEHLAQVRLCKWAADLQLSLQRERERYESLARTERAVWLVQRMGEEVRDGRLQSSEGADKVVRSHGRKTQPFSPDIVRYEIQDPLGLLQWQDRVRGRGWVVLQVVGSFGVMGGVAIWLARTWGITTSIQEWLARLNDSWTTLNER